ncbi:hypothetical protein NL676_017217 [Syzygium grande]|nr:hypothetical protein NL676_017217 [Syzygium grande]
MAGRYSPLEQDKGGLGFEETRGGDVTVAIRRHPNQDRASGRTIGRDLNYWHQRLDHISASPLSFFCQRATLTPLDDSHPSSPRRNPPRDRRPPASYVGITSEARHTPSRATGTCKGKARASVYESVPAIVWTVHGIKFDSEIPNDLHIKHPQEETSRPRIEVQAVWLNEHSRYLHNPSTVDEPFSVLKSMPYAWSP